MAEVEIPEYLERCYWWAYARPWAVWLFDRQAAVNLILWGNYNRLRDAGLAELGERLPGRTLQMGCCYGDLTPRIVERVAKGGGSLDVVDVLPIQLNALRKKLPRGASVSLMRMDASALSMPEDTYDRVIIFMLLHEQPPEYRQKTFAEAMRVLKPGGRIVIVDYAQPAWWHPLRPYLMVLAILKPYVREVWRHELSELLPEMRTRQWRRSSYFGGLFQLLRCDLA